MFAGAIWSTPLCVQIIAMRISIALGQNADLGHTWCMYELILWSTGDAEAGVKTPQKTAWRSNSIAEEPEEEEAGGSGNRPHALSASACQQVWLQWPACTTRVPCVAAQTACNR